MVSIGTNFASGVKPSTHTGTEWNYALFGYYGGGSLVEDYSPGGAFVIAGSGGHNVNPNIGGCLFDFADATWKRVDNSNGVPWRSNDYTPAEVDATYGEITASGWPGIPSPSHQYSNPWQMTSRQGGGTTGTYLLLNGISACTDSSRGSDRVHAFDLNTGRWTRRSTNAYINAGYPVRCSAYDPATNRYYMPYENALNNAGLDYVDGADWTFKTTNFGTITSAGLVSSCFLDDSRRLFVCLVQDSPSAIFLRVFNADNLAAGETLVPMSGSLSDRIYSTRFHYYPADRCWYAHDGYGNATLHKITPPDSNYFAATWTLSTVTVGTTLTQQPQIYIDSGAVHNSRFFFVPALGCFAWIPGGDNNVQLLKP